MSSLKQLNAYGQNFWYEDIRRKCLHDGTIRALIDEDGLRGLISNLSLLKRAIVQGDDYDEQLRELAATGADAKDIYEALVLADVRAGCDLFADLHGETNGEEGYVSLEVSPHLAHDTEGTLSEARRLFAAVGRPNVMIKVPATPAGIPAIRQLTNDGINVNATLIFSRAHYDAVADAYVDGLATRIDDGGDPAQVASVASLSVSPLDTAVDKQLHALDDPSTSLLVGKAAISNARLVYQRFKEIFHQGEAFAELHPAGAPRQRLLWATTGTTNPDYPDTMYVDQLIGAETITTLSPPVVAAFREYGTVMPTLQRALYDAEMVLADLAERGIDLDAVTETLQTAGVQSLADDYDAVLAAIEEKRAALAPA